MIGVSFSSSTVLIVVVAGLLLLSSGHTLKIFRSDWGGNLKLMLLTAASALGVSQYWGGFGDSDSGVKSTQAVQMAQRITDSIANSVTELKGRPKVAVAPFQRDHQEQLTHLVRDWLSRLNVQIVQPTLTRQVLDLVSGREAADASIELGRAMSSRDADYILCGEVLEWSTYPAKKSRLCVRAQLFHVETGKSKFDRTFVIPEESKQQPSVESVPQAIDRATDQVVEWGSEPFVMGVLVWLLLVGLTPWLFARTIAAAMDRDSNMANAFLLLAYALMSAVAAWLSWGRQLSSESSWLVIGIAMLVSVPYFGFVCGRIDEART